MTSIGVWNSSRLRGRSLSSGRRRRGLAAVDREVGALREVLAQQAVGVLVHAALPGRVRVAEEDVDAGVDADLLPVAHLRSLIPGQRPRSCSGSVWIFAASASRPARACNRRAGAAASCSSVWRSTRVPIADWFCVPMIKSPSQLPGHGPVLDLGRPLGDVDHVRDPVLALPDLAARTAHRPPGAQTHRSAPVSTRPGTARRATGRSSR